MFEGMLAAFGWACDVIPPLRWVVTQVAAELEVELWQDDGERVRVQQGLQGQGLVWALPFTMVLTNHSQQKRERIRRMTVRFRGASAEVHAVETGGPVVDIWLDSLNSSPRLFLYARGRLNAKVLYQLTHLADQPTATVCLYRVGRFPRVKRQAIPLTWVVTPPPGESTA